MSGYPAPPSFSEREVIRKQRQMSIVDDRSSEPSQGVASSERAEQTKRLTLPAMPLPALFRAGWLQLVFGVATGTSRLLTEPVSVFTGDEERLDHFRSFEIAFELV